MSLRHLLILTAAWGLAACASGDPGTGPAVPVAAVTVSPATAGPLAPGGTAQLSAAVTDAQGNPLTNRPVVWASAAPAVATVSATGLVTAVAPGTASITATSEGRSGSAAVTVLAPVATVAVSPASATLLVGGTQALTATAQDAGGNALPGRAIAWSSSNTLIATVSATGEVTGLGAGTATISATSEGRTGTATITVLVPVATVTVNPATASLVIGGTQQLSATARDAAGAALTGRLVAWSSGTPGVATVSATGVVTAVSPGTATITATSEGRSGTATITVAPVPVASVAVSPATATVTVGIPQQFSAIARDAAGNALTGRAVTWGSGNTGIATVSATGLVTGVSSGTVTITATVEGRTGTATIAVLPVPVGSVTVSPASATLLLGTTQQLGVTARDPAGNIVTGRPTSWTSGNTGVASVSGSGLVTALAVGTTTITVTVEGRSAAATIRVIPVPVASVVVNPTSATLVIGANRQLLATALDTAGNALTGRPVTWSSDSLAVATVSATGVVTAVATGTATITATVEGRTGSATVTVIAPVATVTVSPAPASLVIETTQQFRATTKDAAGNVLADRTVTWSTSNTGVATVSTTGLVTAVAVGTATITASSEGRNGTSLVTVTPPLVATVLVSPSSASVVLGSTQQLVATALDSAGNTLTGRSISWSSDIPGVASVSGTGRVTAILLGTATITATVEGRTGTATVTVVPVPVARVAIAPASVSVVLGTTQQLTATARDAAGNALTGRPVLWESANPELATVSETGVVTGIALGAVTITATVEGQSATAAIMVVPVPVATVSVSPAPVSLVAFTTQQLSATTRDAAGNILADRVVTWSSSNSGVATVSSAGLVTAVAPGTATITASSEGRSGTSVVTVTPPPVASVTVTPSAVTIAVNSFQQLTATLRDAAGNVLTGRSVEWSSGSTGLASVTNSGVVRGVNPGTVFITARSEGRFSTATITVVPALAVPAGPFLHASGDHTCGLKPDGWLWCWGDNSAGQLGSETPATISTVPLPVTGDFTFARVATSTGNATRSMCALTSGNIAYCWGANQAGQLGDGTTTSRIEPAPVSGGAALVSVALDARFACARTTGGVAYCWGANEAGQLGDGTKVDRPVPTAVAGGFLFRALGAGSRNYGLNGAGAIYSWGGSSSTFLPTLENWGSGWSQLTVGPGGGCLLEPTGAAYCWGDNTAGDLGLPGQTEVSQPTAVVGGLAFKQLSKGRAHTCGLTTTGLAYCWGDNAYGQLGDGTTTARPIPTPVADSRVFVEIGAGANHACASTSAGEVWCWGRNTAGQLGDGTTTNRATPVQVPSLAIKVP